MKVEYRESFARDLKKRKHEQQLLQQVKEVIREVEDAKTVSPIANLKKLKSEGNYYRIRIGEFRIGLSVKNDVVCFIRLLHRRDVYRYFP